MPTINNKLIFKHRMVLKDPNILIELLEKIQENVEHTVVGHSTTSGIGLPYNMGAAGRSSWAAYRFYLASNRMAALFYSSSATCHTLGTLCTGYNLLISLKYLFLKESKKYYVLKFFGFFLHILKFLLGKDSTL